MNELFQIPETKSPRLLWIEKHGVWTSRVKHIDAPNQSEAWKAEAAGHVGVGPTEDDAIVDLAKRMKLKLWNEQ